MTDAWRKGAGAALLAGAAGAVIAGLWAFGDYRRWCALGPGGLSANWRAIAHMTRVTG